MLMQASTWCSLDFGYICLMCILFLGLKTERIGKVTWLGLRIVRPTTITFSFYCALIFNSTRLCFLAVLDYYEQIPRHTWTPCVGFKAIWALSWGWGVKIFCCENFASIRLSIYLKFKQIVLNFILRKICMQLYMNYLTSQFLEQEDKLFTLQLLYN